MSSIEGAIFWEDRDFDQICSAARQESKGIIFNILILTKFIIVVQPLKY